MVPPAQAVPPVLPPVNAPPPALARAAAGESRMTLVSPSGSNQGDGADWATVLGIALVAEIGLVWLAACLALWRRRVALARNANTGALIGSRSGEPGRSRRG